MRIQGLFIDVRTDEVPWRSTSLPGISWFSLNRDGEGDSADSAVLIRMEPGCGYPRHRHVGIEEVLVLCGGYRDEFGVHDAGSYVRYAAGSSHSPIAIGDSTRPSSKNHPACVLFAIAREGVELELDRGRGALDVPASD